MKEFIDKLIEELEGVKSIVNSPADIVWNNAVKMCIYKANELAEEYKDKSSIIDDLKAFLKEKFKYNSEQAEIWADGFDTDSYFRQQKDLYMDRANIYGEVMREIDRLSEEYKVSEMPTGSEDCCEWVLIDYEANVYDTTCRNPHILLEGSPTDNSYEFCPYCGKKIKVAPYTEGE